MGQASPQPMVTTTSAACTISSVQGLGYSPVMSMPTSAMASMAEGLISFPGSEPPDHATPLSPARWMKESERHLGTAGVVGAQEQHRRLAIGHFELLWSTSR